MYFKFITIYIYIYKYLNILRVWTDQHTIHSQCFMGVGGAKELFWCVLLFLTL